MSTTAREFTGNAKFEAALHKSGELFEKVFACQQDSVLILDDEYIPNIVACNPATEKIFGYSCKDLEGKPVGVLHADGKTLKEGRDFIISSVRKDGLN